MQELTPSIHRTSPSPTHTHAHTHMCAHTRAHTHTCSHTQFTGSIQSYSQNHRKCWKARIQNRNWGIRHSWWSLQTASWGESFSVNSLKHQSWVRWHLICYNLDTSWLEERRAPDRECHWADGTDTRNLNSLTYLVAVTKIDENRTMTHVHEKQDGANLWRAVYVSWDFWSVF